MADDQNRRNKNKLYGYIYRVMLFKRNKYSA